MTRLVMVAIVILSLLGPSIVWAQNSDTEGPSSSEEGREAPGRLKDDYLRARKRDQEIQERIKLKEKKDKDQSLDEETEAKTLALENDKNRALRILDHALNFLMRAKTRIQSMERIDDTRKTELISEIDSEISALEQKKAQISEASSREELLKIVREVKKEWLRIRFKIKRLIGEAINARISYLIAKAEAISEHLHKKLEELKADGKDVSRLEEKLENFDQQLEKAKEHYEKAKQAFQEAKSADRNSRSFAQTHAYLRQTLVYLKKARLILAEIAKIIKDLG